MNEIEVSTVNKERIRKELKTGSNSIIFIPVGRAGKFSFWPFARELQNRTKLGPCMGTNSSPERNGSIVFNPTGFNFVWYRVNSKPKLVFAPREV